MYNKIFFPLTIKILLVFLLIKKSASSVLDCTRLKDCFNCSVCGEEDIICGCEWNTHLSKCISTIPIEQERDWKINYKNCEDSLSKIKQENYCGSFIESKNKITIDLPKVKGYYGLLNLYCYYTYESDKTSVTLFNFYIKKLKDNLLIEYIVYFNDGTYDYKQVNNDKLKKSYNEVKYIQFFIKFEETFSDLPFYIEIKMKDYGKIVLLFTIFIIIFGCICCVLAIYCFTKKFRRESNNYNTYIINDNFGIRRNFNNPYNDENIQRRNNKKIIELLLNDPKYLGSKICKKEYEKYGSNCTICLEEFKTDVDKISLTPCYHVFHYKCLSSYMRKNENNIHCPNCNQDLLNSWDKMPENISPEIIQIQNRNYNNNNMINRNRRSNRTRSRRRQNNEINNNNNVGRREDTNVNIGENGSLASRRNLQDRDNNSLENNNIENNNNNENSNNLEVENI